jgi:hypothetical protein
MESALGRFQAALQKEAKQLEEDARQHVLSETAKLDERLKALEERERNLENEVAQRMKEEMAKIAKLRKGLEEREQVNEENLQLKSKALEEREGQLAAREASLQQSATTQPEVNNVSQLREAAATHPGLFGGGSGSGTGSATSTQLRKTAPLKGYVAGVDPIADDDDDAGVMPAKRPDAACSLVPEDWRQHAQSAVAQAETNSGGIRDQFEQQTVFTKADEGNREDASAVVGQAETNAGDLRNQFENQTVFSDAQRKGSQEDPTRAIEEASNRAGTLREQFEQGTVFEKPQEAREDASQTVQSSASNLRAMFESAKKTSEKRGSEKKSLEELIKADQER